MSIHEIVVISGKGGTGKTTLTASIAPFLEKNVIADCDVDAPDLDILLNPEVGTEEAFSGSRKAVIDVNKCNSCLKCMEYCRFSAISQIPVPVVISSKCEGCGVCGCICPEGAISLGDADTGKIFHSKTDYGPMIHGRLVPGEETSGKLVAAVRERAVKKAEQEGLTSVLIDGSPGIACNVISSLSGADTVLIVTEPTKSGLHDMKRVLDIVNKFSGVPWVIINRHDISESVCCEIENYCCSNNIDVVLKLPFDKRFVSAIIKKQIPSLCLVSLYEDAGWDHFIGRLKERIG